MSVPITATGVQGAKITLSATVAGYSQLYNLEQSLQLQELSGYHTGLYGGQAEWLYSTKLNQYGQHWYNLLPDGTLHAWNGSTNPNTGSSAGAIVATVDPSVYANPTLLISAQAPVTPVVTAVFNGTTLLLTPPAGYIGTFEVTIKATDGILSSTRSFLVTST